MQHVELHVEFLFTRCPTEVEMEAETCQRSTVLDVPERQATFQAFHATPELQTIVKQVKEISQESNDCLAVPVDEKKHEEFKPRGTLSQESPPTKAMACLCYLKLSYVTYNPKRTGKVHSNQVCFLQLSISLESWQST